MGIKSIHKRAQYGERLLALEEDGERAIEALEQLRAQLPALRTQIQADTDLTEQERTSAVAEVDATITVLVADIKEFAGGL